MTTAPNCSAQFMYLLFLCLAAYPLPAWNGSGYIGSRCPGRSVCRLWCICGIGRCSRCGSAYSETVTFPCSSECSFWALYHRRFLQIISYPKTSAISIASEYRREPCWSLAEKLERLLLQSRSLARISTTSAMV